MTNTLGVVHRITCPMPSARTPIRCAYMVEDTSYNRPAPSSTAETTRMTNDRAHDMSIDALIDALQDRIEMLRTKLEDWKAEAQCEDTIAP